MFFLIKQPIFPEITRGYAGSSKGQPLENAYRECGASRVQMSIRVPMSAFPNAYYAHIYNASQKKMLLFIFFE